MVLLEIHSLIKSSKTCRVGPLSALQSSLTRNSGFGTRVCFTAMELSTDRTVSFLSLKLFSDLEKYQLTDTKQHVGKLLRLLFPLRIILGGLQRQENNSLAIASSTMANHRQLGKWGKLPESPCALLMLPPQWRSQQTPLTPPCTQWRCRFRTSTSTKDAVRLCLQFPQGKRKRNVNTGNGKLAQLTHAPPNLLKKRKKTSWV